MKRLRASTAALAAATMLLAAVTCAQFIDMDLLPEQPADLLPVPDPALQSDLEGVAERLGLSPLAERRDFAVALVVLEDDDYRLAMINGHEMIYAASLPKIAILFAAMVASQEEGRDIDEALEEDLNRMIRTSCNDCATRAMEWVGREDLLDILQRPDYAFYNPEFSGGIWVGKDYASTPAFRRDPLKGLSHGATAFQVARLYYRLAMGSLVDEAHSRKMLEIMSDPGISHKFVKGLSGFEDVEMWRKSGSWRNYHADSALVEHPGGRYVLVALVEASRGEQALQALAREVHLLLAGKPTQDP
jgi:beta-lactamase class A